MGSARGKVVVEFSTLEDLERIYRLMTGRQPRRPRRTVVVAECNYSSGSVVLLDAAADADARSRARRHRRAVTSRRVAGDVVVRGGLAEHRGHARLAERRVAPPADVGLDLEHGARARRSPRSRPGSRPRSGTRPTRSSCTGTRARRRGGRRRRGRRRSGWPPRPAPSRRRPTTSSTTVAPASTRPAHHAVGERLEAGGDREEHAATLDAVRTAPERLALAHAGHRALGQRADPQRADARRARRRCRARRCRRCRGRRCAGTRSARRRCRAPKMPSSLPASKPSVLRRRWSSTTSSPRSIGRRT